MEFANDFVVLNFRKPNEIIEDIKLPPMVEADWDMDEKTAFERLVDEVLLQERILQ